MQRISFLIFIVSVLYVSGPACATEAAPASAVKASPAPTPKTAPHIALLLPLKSPIFGHAAEAVRQGFLAAASHTPHTLPVKVYECTDEATEIIPLYQQAVAEGARSIAGPLTRSGVNTLANYSGISTLTLALNIAEGKYMEKLYFFGLTAEMEARQIAQLAATNGLKNATLINSGTPLSRRLTFAFTEEWKNLGKHVSGEALYQNNPAAFADLPANEGSMIFLASDAETAHLIRPFINRALPIYATSQLFIGNTDMLTNFDLNEIRFIDMPWMLQPDHPAVMIYPHANPPLEPDMERLYALGIDAYRLLQILADNSYLSSLPLDGVTGQISLNSHRQFQREATPALFWQGRGMTPEQIAAQEAALAAARAAAAASGISAISAPLSLPTQ